jgi:hypothetical protein
MYGVMTPFMWALNATGQADRAFASFGERERRRMQEHNPFGNYVPTKHDVFVAVYIKSGTNWTMQIAHQLLSHGEADFDHIHCVVPWPDSPPFLGDYAIPVADPSIWMASPEQKRVIKSHLSWDMLPYSDEARYILVIRDPKDVIVSSYFFVRDVMFGPAMPSVDTWCKLMRSNRGAIGSWAESAAGYWAQRHRPNVLLLSFKSMKRDLRGTVLKVANFMDVKAPDQVIDQVCLKSSFDYMKEIDHKFAPQSVIPWGRKVVMMRKGAQGGASELLTPAQQRDLDAFFMGELKRLGSDLPYEEFCNVAS